MTNITMGKANPKDALTNVIKDANVGIDSVLVKVSLTLFTALVSIYFYTGAKLPGCVGCGGGDTSILYLVGYMPTISSGKF
jgi:hypothetical protein